MLSMHFLRRFRRHLLIAIIGFVLLGSATAPAQDDLQPYSVYVDQEGVHARCGPGNDYYRTDPLRHGQTLEVYVETADGWLGIRPPDGSFCWLPADVVKLSPSQDFGIVTEENSLAWIGTHLGKANKYLWQVQLAKGEEVAILGRAKREGPDGMKLWLRIVPPAGEFRWVHRDQVVSNPELLLRDKPRKGTPLADGQPTLADEVDQPAMASYEESTGQETRSPRTESRPRRAPREREVSVLQSSHEAPADNEPPRREVVPVASVQPIVPPVVVDSSQVVGSGVAYNDGLQIQGSDDGVARAYEAPLVAFTTRPTVADIGNAHPEASGVLANQAQTVQELADAFQRRGATIGSQQQLVDQSRVVIQPTVTTVSNVTPVDAPAPTNLGVPVPMAQHRSVDSLQLELSRLMARSAPAHEVEAIVVAAHAIATMATSESERQRAAMITQRAQQYQLVARRRDGTSAAVAPMSGASAAVAYPSPVQTAPLPGNDAVDSSAVAEAKGFLVQVFSSRPDSPPFALTDEQGRTTHYVSPAPGANLRRYLNQFIMVRGTQGYSTGLDTPHIIATSAIRQ
jgi:hypothetical protein